VNGCEAADKRLSSRRRLRSRNRRESRRLDSAWALVMHLLEQIFGLYFIGFYPTNFKKSFRSSAHYTPLPW